MNDGTYKTYSLRKAAVLQACGIAPADVRLAGRDRVEFTFVDPDGQVAALIYQHAQRELRLVTEDLYDAMDAVRRLMDGAKWVGK